MKQISSNQDRRNALELLVMPVILIAAFILIVETRRIHGEYRQKRKQRKEQE
jgi:hypothetical protein